MGGLSNAFWLWFPVLVYKFFAFIFRNLWKFNLWILQTISGVPIYYCRPEYRIPGIFLGTFGVMASFNFIFFLFALSSPAGIGVQQEGPPFSQFLFMGFLGIGLLFISRLLIRKGSL